MRFGTQYEIVKILSLGIKTWGNSLEEITPHFLSKKISNGWTYSIETFTSSEI
jgi:hypothetical protein